MFAQQRQNSCLVLRDTSRIFSRLGRKIRKLSEVRQETQVPFLVGKVILGSLSILKKSQSSSPFEALNSGCLSRFQRDVRPPVQMRRGHRSFSSISTGDSDIPSSSEMKDEPAFKLLHGNLTFFLVRASRCPFPLMQQIQGPSNIHIAEGSLSLRCVWKVGFLLHSKSSNQLSS